MSNAFRVVAVLGLIAVAAAPGLAQSPSLYTRAQMPTRGRHLPFSFAPILVMTFAGDVVTMAEAS